MVAFRISTSAWSHNCGMHAIADYLIEQIQKENFAEIFKGAAYDDLLTNFQNLYQQKNLTWAQIREASLASSRENAQIIWGVPLRIMLHNLIARDVTYKTELEIHYLALLDLMVNNQHQEAQTTYPILLEKNGPYLERKAGLIRVATTEKERLKQLKWVKRDFKQFGFKNYCRSILSTGQEKGLFLWLGTDEITVLCQYFNLQPIINGAKTSGDNIPNKLFIVNQGAHWERAILSLPIPTMAPKFQDKHFYQSYLSHRAGSRYFLQHIKKIGEIYFSAQYLEPSSSPKDLETAKTHPLYKVIANQDIKSYVAKNKPSDIEAMKLIELALTCYTSDQFIEWFKLIKDIDIIACQYNKILLAAVVQDKNNIVIKLLAGFTKEFTPANCMLALLHATEKNDSYIAHKILSHPGFYEKSITKNFIGYVKSFVYEPLNTFDKYGIPAIYYAIKHQNVGLVKVLLEKGACINYQLDINQLKILDISTKGASRLTSMPSEETFGFDLSLEIGNPETAVLLTKKLIFTRREYYNRNSNSSGDKLVHLCAKNGKMELVEKIPCSWDDFKPISELTDNNALGKNCLHLTTELNDIDGMIYCLSYDPRLLSSIDEEGNTPLHLAVLNGHIEAVKLLADKYHDKYHGKYQGKYKILDINEKNLKDFSPLMLANKSTKNKEIIKYLKNNGAIDKFQNLVDSITEAFIRRDPDFTPILLQDAKSTALFDENRDTLLHYACSVF